MSDENELAVQFSDAWETLQNHNSELPSSLLLESPQLSTSTLDLLTELCLASFKEVPLFKQFLLPGDYEKEAD